ncbi:hypothetical protein V8059_004483 [Vibrio parahaemolyticus]
MMKITLNDDVEWTDEMDSLLGTKPSAELAEELGLWKIHVEQRIKELGVSPYRNPPIQWTKEMDALLGSDTDPNVAEKLGLTHPNAVSHIGKRRRDLGIEAFRKPSVVRPWTPEEDAILGTKPNYVVAEELGRNAYQVSKRMQELNIPKLSQIDPEVEKRRQAENAEQDRLNAIAHKRFMSEGLALWSLMWRGYSITKATEELGVPRSRANKLFHGFRRLVRHPKRLGRDIMKDEPLHLIEEIRRRTEYEINHNDSSIWTVWSESWPEIHEDK